MAGTPKLVLVQCFERRCLTYTPDNPAGWQVEAGNVGRHYERWRYGQTTASGTLLLERDGDLFTVNVDGSGLRNLTADFEPFALNPEWSPDGERIVFVGAAERFDPRGTIFVMSADGSGLQQVTSGPVDGAPTWSPDGSSIAFVRMVGDDPEADYFEAESQIFIVGADGSNLTALAETKGDGQPQWSPDGQAIVFLQVGGGGWDFNGSFLWIVNVDRTGLLQLAGGERTDPRDAVWSPQGGWIAQSVGLEGTPGQPAGLHLIRPNGSERVQLTHFGMWPTWSPDGEHLAFAAPDGVVVMNRQGTELTFVADAFERPQWRPVGQ